MTIKFLRTQIEPNNGGGGTAFIYMVNAQGTLQKIGQAFDVGAVDKLIDFANKGYNSIPGN